MSDKAKNFAAPIKPLKTKRPSTVSVASSSRTKTIPAPTTRKVPPRTKFNSNATVLGDADMTIRQESTPDFDAEYRKIAYGNFLRAMLDECIIDEKIKIEENQIDKQMTYLADRFHKTVDILDKTNSRLKEVSFVVEQKRLLDLKNRDCSKFYEITDSSNAQEMLQHFSNKEQACLNKLETKNIDFGYDKNSGHKQLLDAVNDAIEGLEHIKKNSNLDMHKFKEYEKSVNSLDELNKERLDFESLTVDFEAKFPKLNEELLKEASEKIAKMIEDDD